MPTVLLRLSGPMQAWAAHTPFESHHDTLTRPTKSGVIGLVANALGHDRTDDTSHLAALHFTVRADRPGHLEHDDYTAGAGTFPLDTLTLHTHPELAQQPDRFIYAAPREATPKTPPKASWAPSTRKTTKGRKTYIVDGAFLAGLTGPQQLTDAVHEALMRPARLLHLGRRCCPPARLIPHGTTPWDTEWPHHVPLLPEATTPHPHYWQETLDPTAPALPEQPPTRYADRDHRTLAMTSHTATPPPAPQETW
ncbi:type I-E CRISPR-associated protein Cas5/CasD [Streptomyces sp. NPDC006703]|uniref:type I-E CRISPR-associated protein Cas5/CasD n=1 Tax=Streptomyces sp. NPDC006703 TaxID=3364759 RepID=UPI00367CAA77